MKHLTNETVEMLKFFSLMTGSATHEVKNILSIINENAGLMEDLSTAAQNGTMTLSPDRIQQGSGKIGTQVKRADQVLKNLNHFSHCLDAGTELINLADATAFILSLGTRLIEISGTKINFEPGSDAITIRINPFILYYSLWQTLDTVCRFTEGEKEVSVEIALTEKTPCVSFSIDSPANNCFNKLSELKDDRVQLSDIEFKFFEDNCSFGVFFSQDA